MLHALEGALRIFERQRWWMRAKDEWIAAQREGRAFVNPLEPKTLRWCS
jgi:predicted transcriptional regulator